jgi:hypothetical protein
MFGVLSKLARLMPEVEFIGEGQNDSTILRAMETKDDVEVARIRQMGAVTTTVVAMVRDYLTSCDVREDEVLLKEDGTPLTIGDVKAKMALWLAERDAVDVEGMILARPSSSTSSRPRRAVATSTISPAPGAWATQHLKRGRFMTRCTRFMTALWRTWT